jgi:hypothetical protein
MTQVPEGHRRPIRLLDTDDRAPPLPVRWQEAAMEEPMGAKSGPVFRI